ncbi:tRNA (adenine(22)-N(1))-methyltransferase [Tepidimicrobium xylanilyticum]|uniref:tRNA (Adenine22-N1)-methyltransferase n=1 Tax=Tepidimicrobium xylanilyticum TaxID=1123352 RepID=A0A1H2T0M8_9FIRM|nr:class I SAM-dependent methyltransferase [Tepidimicrobium xylanilyticum]GMG96059.1 SAM-dependent methyltransferase [Tepidimicrobium xylanilyticum]SDW37265.1 tRNA (adenine22-N1)-methyltransferase [Tepidimicrobium xylanilyticum]
MRLSSRLQAIADLIPPNTIVADIGTDHGYIPIYLIKNKIAKKVIATDLSKNSLAKTIQLVKEENLENHIDIRLGNGLEVLKPFEVDTVVISGMGGLLIRDILDKDRNKRDSITHFILQPNVASRELREYLYINSFEIIDEKLVKEDDKFYEIIYAKKGKSIVEDYIHYEIGEKLILKKDPLLKDFVEEKISILNNVLEKLKDKNTEKSKNRYEEIVMEVNKLKEVLKGIEGNRYN